MALIDSTALSIDGIDLSQYATRGLHQTLSPIEQSRKIRRTVNGTARDVSGIQFRNKYDTHISCSDQEGPGLVGIYIGKLIQIVCLPDLGGGADSDYPLTLTMLVTNWHVDKDEAGHIVGWELDATEV